MTVFYHSTIYFIPPESSGSEFSTVPLPSPPPFCTLSETKEYKGRAQTSQLTNAYYHFQLSEKRRKFGDQVLRLNYYFVVVVFDIGEVSFDFFSKMGLTLTVNGLNGALFTVDD